MLGVGAIIKPILQLELRLINYSPIYASAGQSGYNFKQNKLASNGHVNGGM